MISFQIPYLHTANTAELNGDACYPSVVISFQIPYLHTANTAISSGRLY